MAKQYPRELRERAVRLVIEHRGDYETEYAAIRSIAAAQIREAGVYPGKMAGAVPGSVGRGPRRGRPVTVDPRSGRPVVPAAPASELVGVQ